MENCPYNTGMRKIRAVRKKLIITSQCPQYFVRSLTKSIFKHTHNYFFENNIIYKYHFGFQPGASSTNNVVEIYNTIISSLDKGKDVKFVFCDISKAFVMVWHKCVLYELKLSGIWN